MSKAPVLSLTSKAAQQIQVLLKAAPPDTEAIRIGIKAGGCSGYKYAMEYAKEVAKFDEVIEEKGVRLLIDPKALMYFLGCVMDYADNGLEAGFTFENPNVKGKCGCGSSFNI